MHKITQADLELVHKLARFKKGKVPPHVELDDLVGAGMLGLVDAANRYKQTPGATFRTYAALRIKGSIIDYLRSVRWFGRFEPEHFDVSTGVDSIEELQSVSEYNETRIDFQKFMSGLTGRKLAVVIMKLEGYTNVEIGKRFGVSEGRICQIFKEATDSSTSGET